MDKDNSNDEKMLNGSSVKAFPFRISVEDETYVSSGLSTRDLFAAMAIQGVAPHLHNSMDIEIYANRAVLIADALIAKLNTPREGK